MALTRREVDEIKPWVKETVKKRLGYSESSVVNAAIQCLQKNLDKDSACRALSSLLDDLAPAFVNDLFSKVDRMRTSKSSGSKGTSHKKRTLQDVFGDEARDEDSIRDESETLKKRKKTRFEALKDDNVPLPPAMEEPIDTPQPLDSGKISAMLSNMKKEIQQRKNQLEKFRAHSAPVVKPEVPVPSVPIVPNTQPVGQMVIPSAEEQAILMNEAIQKVKKAADLHNRIQAKVRRLLTYY